MLEREPNWRAPIPAPVDRPVTRRPSPVGGRSLARNEIRGLGAVVQNVVRECHIKVLHKIAERVYPAVLASCQVTLRNLFDTDA